MAIEKQTIFRGDTPFMKFSLRDSNGDLIDLTSSEVWFVMKSVEQNIEVNNNYTVNRLVEFVDTANGEVRIQLTKDETAVVDTYLCELEVRDYDQEFQPSTYSPVPSGWTIPSSGISHPSGANETNLITGARFKLSIKDDIRRVY